MASALDSPRHVEYRKWIEKLTAEWRPATASEHGCVSEMAISWTLLGAAGQQSLGASGGTIEVIPADPEILRIQERVQRITGLLPADNGIFKQPVVDPETEKWLAPLIRQASPMYLPADYASKKIRSDYVTDVLLGRHALGEGENYPWRVATQGVLDRLRSELASGSAKLTERRVVRQTPEEAFRDNFPKLEIYQSYRAKLQRLLERQTTMLVTLQTRRAAAERDNTDSTLLPNIDRPPSSRNQLER